MLPNSDNITKEAALQRHMFDVAKESYSTNEYNQIYRERGMSEFEECCFRRFLALIVPHPTILDVGCGSGVPYDKYISPMCKKLIGIDISPKQIERARCNVPNAEFICANILDVDITCTYDGILMLYSLFHIHRSLHKQVLRILFKCLADSGSILMTIRKNSSRNGVKYLEDFCGKPMYWSHFDYGTFCSMAEDVGFSVEYLGDEINFGSNESHCWILLAK